MIDYDVCENSEHTRENLRSQVDDMPLATLGVYFTELPEEITQNGEFRVLADRFKSLFSWPLIMGETPV